MVATAPAAAAPPASPKPLPCDLDAKQRKRVIRQERQFLKRYSEEAAHRRAQLAALKPVVNGIRVGYKRYYELVAQRKPLDKERAVYESKPVPAWLQTKLDTSDAQFVGLTKVLRGHEQKIGEIQARYQCQRDTYGKLWAGAAPGIVGLPPGRPAHRPEPSFPLHPQPKECDHVRIATDGRPAHPRDRWRHWPGPRDGRALPRAGRRRRDLRPPPGGLRRNRGGLARAFPGRRIDTFGVDIRIAQAVEDMVQPLWHRAASRAWSTTLPATSSRPPKACRRAASTRSPTSSSMALLRDAGGGQTLGRRGGGAVDSRRSRIATS